MLDTYIKQKKCINIICIMYFCLIKKFFTLLYSGKRQGEGRTPDHSMCIDVLCYCVYVTCVDGYKTSIMECIKKVVCYIFIVDQCVWLGDLISHV